MAKPSTFPEANNILTGWGSVQDLQVHNDGITSVSLWRLTWCERLSALVFGKVWLFVQGGESQPPVSVWAIRTVFQKKEAL